MICHGSKLCFNSPVHIYACIARFYMCISTFQVLQPALFACIIFFYLICLTLSKIALPQTNPHPTTHTLICSIFFFFFRKSLEKRTSFPSNTDASFPLIPTPALISATALPSSLQGSFWWATRIETNSRMTDYRVYEHTGGAPCHRRHWGNTYKIPHKRRKITHFNKGNRPSPRRENPRTALSDTAATGPMWPLSVWSVASSRWAALHVQNTHGRRALVWRRECQRSHQSFLYWLHVNMVFWILC